MQLDDPKWCQQYWLNWIEINSTERKKSGKENFVEQVNSGIVEQLFSGKVEDIKMQIDIQHHRHCWLHYFPTAAFELAANSTFSASFLFNLFKRILFVFYGFRNFELLDKLRTRATRRRKIWQEKKKYDYDMSNWEDRRRKKTKENATDSTMMCNMLGMIQTNESSSVCEWRVSDTSVN